MLFVRSMICFLAMDNVNHRYVMAGDAENIHAPIAAAGGLEDGTSGTSFGKIASAVERVNFGSGVAILMDMGSAVMTAEMVLESVNDPQIRLIDCPIAEGAVVAAMESVAGNSLDDIVAATGNWSAYKKF